MKDKRIWLKVVLIFSLLFLITFSSGCGTTTQENKSADSVPKVGIKIGNLAPDFSVSTLEGRTIKLSELRGKPVFLNFWATWCPPCNQEMPDIEKISKDGFPVQIIGINEKESPMVVGSFLSQKGYTFPVAFDLKGDVAGLYMVTGIPTSYAIDANGIIRYIQTGPLTYAQLQQWFTELSQSTK